MVDVDRVFIKSVFVCVKYLAATWVIAAIPVLKVDTFAESAISVDTRAGP